MDDPEPLTGVPADRVQQVTQDYEHEGATVTAELQADGTYTLTVKFPHPAEPVVPGFSNLGVDLNHANDFPDNLADYHLAFVWHKASEGNYMTDDKFVERRKLADDQGIPFGAYHFGSDADVAEQVELFLSRVQLSQPPGKPYPALALDWEKPKNHGVMSEDQARDFLRLVEEKIGIVPCIYGSDKVTESRAATQAHDETFARARLWIAAPVTGGGELPAGAQPRFRGLPFKGLKSWSKITVWQYSADYDKDTDTDFRRPACARFFGGADWNQITNEDLASWPFHSQSAPLA